MSVYIDGFTPTDVMQSLLICVQIDLLILGYVYMQTDYTFLLLLFSPFYLCTSCMIFSIFISTRKTLILIILLLIIITITMIILLFTVPCPSFFANCKTKQPLINPLTIQLHTVTYSRDYSDENPRSIPLKRR